MISPAPDTAVSGAFLIPWRNVYRILINISDKYDIMEHIKAIYQHKEESDMRKAASFIFVAAIALSAAMPFTAYSADAPAQKTAEEKEADIRQRTLLKQALDQVVDAGTPKEDIACYEIPHSDRNVTCVVILGNNGISKLFLSDSEGVKANIDYPDTNSFVYGYSENEEILVKESAENGYRYVVYKFNGKELEELSVLNVNGEDITYDGKALTPEECDKAIEELKAGFNEFSELEKLPYDSAIFKFYRPVSDTWQQRYIELMDAYLDNFLSGNASKNDTCFELCDINSDGKPELYVYAPESATMLAFPRETAPLALLNSSFGNDQMIVRYTKGGNKNYLTYNSDGSTMYIELLMKDDAVSYGNMLWEENGAYYNGGIELTAEEYNKLMTETTEGVTDELGKSAMTYAEVKAYLLADLEDSVQTTTVSAQAAVTSTTTTTAKTTASTSKTAKTSDSPKTGDSGSALVVTVLAGAIGLAFSVRKKHE